MSIETYELKRPADLYWWKHSLVPSLAPHATVAHPITFRPNSLTRSCVPMLEQDHYQLFRQAQKTIRDRTDVQSKHFPIAAMYLLIHWLYLLPRTEYAYDVELHDKPSGLMKLINIRKSPGIKLNEEQESLANKFVTLSLAGNSSETTKPPS